MTYWNHNANNSVKKKIEQFDDCDNPPDDFDDGSNGPNSAGTLYFTDSTFIKKIYRTSHGAQYVNLIAQKTLAVPCRKEKRTPIAPEYSDPSEDKINKAVDFGHIYFIKN